MRASLLFLLLLFLPLRLEGRLLEGTVRDQVTKEPIAGAEVRFQASQEAVVSDPNGHFSLLLPEGEERRGKVTVTAWREGYLNGGVEVPDKGVVEILLQPVFEGDHKEYRWTSPDPPSLLEWADIIFWKAVSSVTQNKKLKRLESRFASNCSNCHGSTTVREWRQDAHSQSAVNPIVLTMYQGTSLSGKEGVFPGYRLDFPKSAGNCAACHAPAAAMKNPWGTDLAAVSGVGRQGVFCDFCHKVRDVLLHPEGGYPGLLSMKFHRPPKGEQIFFGPLKDVIAGPDTYAAVFQEGRFCAPCHSARFWGVPIYSDYDEWLESPYPKERKSCQSCHMAPDKKTVLIAPEEKGGVRRSPETLATHTNPGSRDRDFLAKAVKMELNSSRKGGILKVSVKITNTGAGHHFPTGVPMRNMILLVEARDAEGRLLPYLDGPVVPAWGGVGPVELRNFAGLPGKGFAKILADASKKFPRYDPGFRRPTPHWRQSVIVSDNRIPAKKTDVSDYEFEWGKGLSMPVRISVCLIYRRAFKPWIDAKGWPLEDLEIARSAQVIH